MSLTDFIYASNEAVTPEELKKCFLSFIKNFGMDRFIMGEISHDSTVTKLKNMDIIANYPEEWLKHYKHQEYVNDDIVYQTALTTNRPFTWHDITHGKKISDKARKILNEAQEFHLYNGIGLSIHQPFGNIIGIGLASSSKELSYDKNILHTLYAASNQFFIAHSSLINAEQPVNQNHPPPLTLRERETLLWLARGKSRSEISDILGISRTTVNRHCENILQKLDVNNVPFAVVKALRTGLLPSY